MKINRVRYVVLILSFLFLMFGGYLGLRLKTFMPEYQCFNTNGYKGAGCYIIPLQRLEYGIKESPENHDFTLPFPGYTILWGPWMAYGRFLGVFLLVVLLSNKAWCGWMCPFGAFQDAISFIRKKFRIKETQFSEAARNKLNLIKYLCLFLFLIIHIILLYDIGLANKVGGPPFCSICPVKLFLPLFEGNIHNFSVDFTFGIHRFWTSIATTFIGGIILVGLIFKERCFCYVCPIGACMDLTKKISLLKLKKNTSTCSGCGNCWRACPMDIKEVYLEKGRADVNKENCIFCLKCIEACPKDKTLSAALMRKNIFVSSRAYFTKWIKGRTDKDKNTRR